MNIKFIFTGLIFVVFSACSVSQRTNTLNPQTLEVVHQSDSFFNPIGNGADPWVTKHDGYYYVCLTGRGPNGSRAITVSKSKSLTKPGKKVQVWHTPDTGWNSNSLWAPELHRVGKKWYIY